MSNNILESVDNLVGELVEEVRAKKKKVMRGGNKVTKMSCPSGFKYDKQSNNCIRMTGPEKRIRSKAALKGAKVRSRNTFGKAQALKKRKITMRKGEQKGLYTKY
jgi:hypothetical protein